MWGNSQHASLCVGRYQFRSHHVGRSYRMGNGSTNITDRNGKCRDAVFLLIFFTFWVGLIVNSSIGFNQGKPSRSAPTHVVQNFIDSSSVVRVKGVTFQNSQHKLIERWYSLLGIYTDGIHIIGSDGNEFIGAIPKEIELLAELKKLYLALHKLIEWNYSRRGCNLFKCS